MNKRARLLSRSKHLIYSTQESGSGNVPKMNWPKPTIQKWMDKRGMAYDPNDNKVQLLEKINSQS